MLMNTISDFLVPSIDEKLCAYIGGKQYFPDIEKRPIIKTDRFV